MMTLQPSLPYCIEHARRQPPPPSQYPKLTCTPTLHYTQYWQPAM